ncbi:hypothetical protein MATL_G00223440 [Megalops atlanticus]|uniref:Uncharacterized protein n=1 Tax=Megalops atlanticus TaxID=7932 RepID=A0A9D3PGI1_MEGAT|nr:hypothetical protein MATL_G00223440 [Megalops atlanticus]
MTRAAITKLLILVLVAFIMCLPEFFTSHQAVRIDLSCTRYPEDMGEPGNVSQTQRARDAGGGSGGRCISDCPGAVNTSLLGDSSEGWYLCKTETDLCSLQGSIPLSEADIELSLAIQSTNGVPHVLSVSGLVTRQLFGTSKLDRQGFHCCADCAAANGAALPAAASGCSCCVLHIPGANATPPNATLLGTHPPRESWLRSTRALWLALILIVILLVLGAVLHEVRCKNQCYTKRSEQLLVDEHQSPETPQRRLDEQICVEIFPSTTSDDRYPRPYRSRHRSWRHGITLSPIHETEVTDEEGLSQEDHLNHNDSVELLPNQKRSSESLEILIHNIEAESTS